MFRLILFAFFVSAVSGLRGHDLEGLKVFARVELNIKMSSCRDGGLNAKIRPFIGYVDQQGKLIWEHEMSLMEWNGTAGGVAHAHNAMYPLKMAHTYRLCKRLSHEDVPKLNDCLTPNIVGFILQKAFSKRYPWKPELIDINVTFVEVGGPEFAGIRTTFGPYIRRDSMASEEFMPTFFFFEVGRYYRK
uniref:Uncharacterized protein n=1 Tax=Steinernema glaseri TaxID=37863 RepID=A0A1I7ZGS6_9BILA